MNDFDDWNARQVGTIATPEYGATKHKPVTAVERELPDGVREAGPGVYMARCRSCKQEYEILWDIWEDGFTEEGNYCGKSDRCLP